MPKSLDLTDYNGWYLLRVYKHLDGDAGVSVTKLDYFLDAVKNAAFPLPPDMDDEL